VNIPLSSLQGNALAIAVLVGGLLGVVSCGCGSEGLGRLDEKQASTYTTPCLVRSAVGASMPLVAAIIPLELGTRARFTHAVYNEAIRQGVSPVGAVLLTSHFALSTGFGNGAWNYMLAGVKVPNAKAVCNGTAPAPAYDFMCLCTSEKGRDGRWLPGCTDQCPPKHGRGRCRHAFRSAKSLSDGVSRVLKTMQNSRYTQLRAYLAAGSREYYRELCRAGWYTGCIPSVSNPNAAEKKYRDFLAHEKAVRKYLGQAASPPPSGGGIFFAALGLVGAWYVRKKGWI